MRVILGNPPGEEHSRLEQAFKQWVIEHGGVFLPREIVTFRGLESHRPDEHVKLGSDELLAEAETCDSLHTPHTRSQWSTFWAYASSTPNCMFVIVLPKSCVTQEGCVMSKRQIESALQCVLGSISVDLCAAGITLDAGRLQAIFL